MYEKAFITECKIRTAGDYFKMKVIQVVDVENTDWRDYLYIYLIVFYALFWMIYALFNL